jgi:hypothetical protein
VAGKFIYYWLATAKTVTNMTSGLPFETGKNNKRMINFDTVLRKPVAYVRQMDEFAALSGTVTVNVSGTRRDL